MRVQLNIADSPEDRRVRRTRSTLTRAFEELLILEGYDAITPTRIARNAGVGRSTFYEHFRGKEEMLRNSLLPILLPIADCIDSPDVPSRLLPTLEHIRTSRGMARPLLSGRARLVASKALADLIEGRLKEQRLSAGALPTALTAALVAGGVLNLLEAWLTSREACSAGSLARAVHANTRAIACSATE
jgi:AcrR family transcriptional regulator